MTSIRPLFDAFWEYWPQYALVIAGGVVVGLLLGFAYQVAVLGPIEWRTYKARRALEEQRRRESENLTFIPSTYERDRDV